MVCVCVYVCVCVCLCAYICLMGVLFAFFSDLKDESRGMYII